MHALLDDAQPNASTSATARSQNAHEHPSPVDIISEGQRAVSAAFLFAAEALAQLGSPALMFDGARKVLAANRLIKTLPKFIRLRAQNTLSFVDPVAETRFREAAAELDKMAESQMRFFAARCPEGDTAIARILSVRPIPGVATTPPAGMLIFFPLAKRSGPSAALLQSLFALTPAEARVARRLAEGTTINELASAARVSRNTVRSQVRGVLQKTGCNRQSEAVGLLCRIGAVGCADEQSVLT